MPAPVGSPTTGSGSPAGSRFFQPEIPEPLTRDLPMGRLIALWYVVAFLLVWILPIACGWVIAARHWGAR